MDGRIMCHGIISSDCEPPFLSLRVDSSVVHCQPQDAFPAYSFRKASYLSIGVGAQSTLGGHDIFAQKYV